MKRHTLFGSLRGRLIALVILTVLPGFVVGALNAINMMERAQSTTRASLMSALKRVKHSEEVMVREIAADIDAATRRVAGSETACPTALVTFAQQSPEYLDVGLARGDGQIVCDLPQPGLSTTLIDRKLIQRALGAPGRPVSALITARGERLPRLVVLRALATKGVAGPVVYASVKLAPALDLTFDPIANDAQIFVFDVNGHRAELDTATGRHSSHPLSQSEFSQLDIPKRLTPEAEPSIIRLGADLIALVPLGAPGEPDGIMLHVSRQDLYRGVWQELRRSVTVLGLALIFILAFAWWVSERLIMEPAKALVHAADRLALGDLSTRTGLPPGNSEFSRVAVAFDRMAEGIQQRTLESALHLQELTRANRLHEVLTAINAAILRRGSTRWLLDEICRIACEIGGFSHAWISEIDTEANVLRPVCWAGQQSDVWANFTISLDPDTPEGRGAAATAARTGVAVVINDFLEDPITAPWHALGRKIGIGSALALPMGMSESGQRRVLALYSSEVGYFAAEEVSLIEQVAQDAAFGLHLIATEQALLHTSSHDPITGLPNHALLKQRLGDAIRQARGEGKKLLVSVLEVGFEGVVSQWGSKQGHALFKQAGQEIESLLSRTDMVGVLTGARFAIIMGDVEQLDTAGLRMQSLVERLQVLHVPAAHGFITPRVMVGIAVFPNDSEDPDDLVDRALGALTLARRDGEDSIQFFSPEIGQSLQENRKLAQQLHGAIARNELVLHYQPIVSIETGALRGFEALLRWTHPTMGDIRPDRFIPLAENSGLISTIGEWVVEQAARQAAAWANRGATDLSITINVSAVQLRDAHFAERIGLLLDAPGMRSTGVRLAMEVTESQLVANIDKSIAILEELKALGIAIIIDDFGTGYSSLSYLHRLPLDVLKIDKSFTRNIDTHPQDQKMVAGILALARSFELDTVAEGIERAEQLQVVKLMGCTLAQGFLYDRALPADEVERKWLPRLFPNP